MIQWHARLLWASMVVLISGCATITPQPQETVPVEDVEDLPERYEGLKAYEKVTPEPSDEPYSERRIEVPPELREQAEQRSPTPTRMTPAVVALVEDAEQRLGAQNYSSAAATYERALRLDPRNGVLWYRLADVRLQEGKPTLAIQLAMKSNALAGRDDRLRSWNWNLIADAREQLGDRSGAREARARAAELRGD